MNHIVSITLDKLELNEGQIEGVKTNPRDLHNDGFAKAVKSITDFPEMLEVRVLVVVEHNSKYIVIGGNQRLRALRELKYNEAPCMIVDWSQDKINEFIIKDNIEYGTWNYDLLANEWETELLVDWGLDLPFDQEELEFDAQADEDEIPELPNEPVSKLGDIWLLGEHRLMCGDSTLIDDVEKLMDGAIPSIIWTDPPYGISINYDQQYSKSAGNGVAKRQNYGKILNDENTDVIRDCYNLISQLYSSCIIVLWGGNYYDFLPASKCWLSWYKRQDLPEDTFCDTELAYTNSNKHTKTINVQWKGMIKEGEHEKRVHPTQKPILLTIQGLDYLGIQENGLVVDLFGGSGSTLIACQKTSRINYSMELDPKYCDVIIKRWEKYTGKDAILESTKQNFKELST